jgi:YD repeat-containing protein
VKLALLALLGSLVPAAVADASATYTYDSLGRLVATQYDNGVCIAYTFDANGNRTQSVTASNGPIWGSSAWGCFVWTAH